VANEFCRPWKVPSNCRSKLVSLVVSLELSVMMRMESKKRPALLSKRPRYIRSPEMVYGAAAGQHHGKVLILGNKERSCAF